MVKQLQAFIPGGQQVSNNILNLSGLNVIGIIIPGNWTAANITFQVSVDGTNFFNLYDDSGNEVTITTGGAGRAFVNLTKLHAFDFLKVRSGTSGSPVVQSGDKPVIVICEEEE